METQTIPPSDLQIINSTDSSVELSWIPIPYTGHFGYYEISYSGSPGGPFITHGTTSNKTATGYLADNLPEGTSYYFLVRTFTPAHGFQQNDLWSEYTRVDNRFEVYFPIILRQ
jgi:hypothetical protein